MQDHPAARSLNEFLRNKLITAHCTAGRLECRITGTLLLTLRGQREDGKSMLFWDLERPLKRLIDDYLKSTDPDAVALIIEIDLARDTFEYRHLSRQEAAKQEEQEAAERKRTEERRLQEMKQQISLQTIPYGRELAEKVADALRHGALAHSHRDYCGMGLEINSEGEYLYGEVWDGGLAIPLHRFPDKAAFVGWLAVQSDASMAMLDAKDSWYWNNQVITRNSLEAFIQGI